MDVLIVDLKSATPIYEQIVERIRERVGDGSLRPGAPLPSVRQLARDLDVNPNTVAKAYLLLERDGIVRTVRRKGTFVAEEAVARARASADQRVDLVLDRLLGEAAGLGMDPQELLDAIKRRIEQDDPPRGRPGGASS